MAATSLQLVYSTHIQTSLALTTLFLASFNKPLCTTCEWVLDLQLLGGHKLTPIQLLS